MGKQNSSLFKYKKNSHLNYRFHATRAEQHMNLTSCKCGRWKLGTQRQNQNYNYLPCTLMIQWIYSWKYGMVRWGKSIYFYILDSFFWASSYYKFLHFLKLLPSHSAIVVMSPLLKWHSRQIMSLTPVA